MTAIIAAIEEGGPSFILFTLMVVAIYIVHKLTIAK